MKSCCCITPTVLFDRSLVYGITQADTTLPPTAFTVRSTNAKPTKYMYGIVNGTTGLVKAVGFYKGDAAGALALANTNLATWLAANGFTAATNYTVFITADFGEQAIKTLAVGDAYSGLSAFWGTPITKCFRVATVTAGAITTTAVCS